MNNFILFSTEILRWISFLLYADSVFQSMLDVLIHQSLSKAERQYCLAVSVARKEASFVIDILSLSSALAFRQLLIVWTCLCSNHKGFHELLSASCHSTSFPHVIFTPCFKKRKKKIYTRIWWVFKKTKAVCEHCFFMTLCIEQYCSN